MSASDKKLISILNYLHEFTLLSIISIFVYLVEGGTTNSFLPHLLFLVLPIIFISYAEKKIASTPLFLLIEFIPFVLVFILPLPKLEQNIFVFTTLLLFICSIEARIRYHENLVTFPHLHGFALCLLSFITANSLKLTSFARLLYILTFLYTLLYFIHLNITRRNHYFQFKHSAQNKEQINTKNNANQIALNYFILSLTLVMFLGFIQLSFSSIVKFLERIYQKIIDIITAFFQEEPPLEAVEDALTTTPSPINGTDAISFGSLTSQTSIVKIIIIILGICLLIAVVFISIYLLIKLFKKIAPSKEEEPTSFQNHVISEEHTTIKPEKRPKEKLTAHTNLTHKIRRLYKETIQSNTKKNEEKLSFLTPTQLEQNASLQTKPYAKTLHTTYQTVRYSNKEITKADYKQLKTTLRKTK